MANQDKYHLSWDCDRHTSTPEYAGRFAGSTGAFLLGRQSELLAGFLGEVSGRKVLDAGGGHGQNAETIINAGGSYRALVSSPGSAAMLERELGRLGIDPEEVIDFGRLDGFPYADGSFDAVISFRIISHVPDWRLYLGELCRVASRSVIIDFAPDSCRCLKGFFSLLKGRFETASREFSVHSTAEIQAEAEKNGFTLKKIEREFVLPMIAHRVLGSRFLPAFEHAASGIGITRFAGGPAVALLERREGP